jgi:ketosteroid isomerase-like protein
MVLRLGLTDRGAAKQRWRMTSSDPVEMFVLHVRLMAAADVDGLKAMYADDAYYYDPLSGKLIGSEQIAPYLASIGDYFDSLEAVPVNVWRDEAANSAAVEWHQTTTRQGVERLQRGIALVTGRDGLVVEHRDYFSLGRPDYAEEIRSHLVVPAPA